MIQKGRSGLEGGRRSFRSKMCPRREERGSPLRLRGRGRGRGSSSRLRSSHRSRSTFLPPRSPSLPLSHLHPSLVTLRRLPLSISPPRLHQSSNPPTNRIPTSSSLRNSPADSRRLSSLVSRRRGDWRSRRSTMGGLREVGRVGRSLM